MSTRTMTMDVWSLGLRRLALSLCVAGALTSSAAAQSYMVTDLGTLGGIQSFPVAINASGQVAGTSVTTDNVTQHAFLTSGGPMTDLGTLGGRGSQATAMNNSGQVTGNSSTGNGIVYHAFLFSNGVMSDIGTLGGAISWGIAINSRGDVIGHSELGNMPGVRAFKYSDGVMTDIGTLGGPWTGAAAINDAGQVTGGSMTADGANLAYLYTDGVMTSLGHLGIPNSAGLAINASGQVAGRSFDADWNVHAFRYSNGVMTDLGTLGGTYSLPVAIDNAGQIVGQSSIAGDTETHPFLFSNGLMTDLGSLGGTYATAVAINAAGHVIGTASVPGDVDSHVFLSIGGAPMIDVNTAIPNDSGWTLNEAIGINDRGQITGWGHINGQLHAFLLTPTSTRTARVQQPIEPDGSSVFNAKRGVIPVRFTLAVNGSPTCALPPATIALTRTSGGTIGPVDESLYLAAADEGQNFRISDCLYVYNLGASGLGAGHYRVDITIDGSVIGHGEFSLK